MDFEYEIINLKERLDNLQESFIKAQMNIASITSRADEALTNVGDLISRLDALESIYAEKTDPATDGEAE